MVVTPLASTSRRLKSDDTRVKTPMSSTSARTPGSRSNADADSGVDKTRDGHRSMWDLARGVESSHRQSHQKDTADKQKASTTASAKAGSEQMTPRSMSRSMIYSSSYFISGDKGNFREVAGHSENGAPMKFTVIQGDVDVESGRLIERNRAEGGEEVLAALDEDRTQALPDKSDNRGSDNRGSGRSARGGASGTGSSGPGTVSGQGGFRGGMSGPPPGAGNVGGGGGSMPGYGAASKHPHGSGARQLHSRSAAASQRSRDAAIAQLQEELVVGSSSLSPFTIGQGVCEVRGERVTFGLGHTLSQQQGLAVGGLSESIQSLTAEQGVISKDDWDVLGARGSE